MKRSEKQYNKEVDAYKYFLVVGKKAITGFEFKEDCKDAQKDIDTPSKIMSLSQMKKEGIKDPRPDWKFK